jgi:predicted lipid-binding transport protein (Tim44 family)
MVDGGGFATGTGPSGSGGISAHDPGFDQTNFVSWAEGVHFAMVTAFSTGEPQHVRPFVSDSLYQRLAAQITAMTADQRTRVDTSDPHAVIVHAHTDASVDTIAVKVDGSVGLPDGGSGPSRWTFQRSSQATTPAGGLSAAAPPTCASCGAPLKLDPSGECAFCRTPFKIPSDNWALVEIAASPPAGAPFVTATTPWGSTTVETVGVKAARSLISLIIIGSIILGVVAAIAGVVVAVSGANNAKSVTTQAQSATAQAESAANAAASSVEQQASSAFAAITTLPAIAAPTTPPTTPTLSVDAHLTLSGSINLNPSQLDQGAFTLNGHTDGACPSAKEPLHTITLNATFDSGASLQGSFALSTPIGRGASADFANGGAAILHFVGPTQAAADDEKWPMPAGQPGLVTVTTDANGGGTLKWQSLQSSEPSSNYAGPLSGLATWTCG